jgi:hypothetical protein
MSTLKEMPSPMVFVLHIENIFNGLELPCTTPEAVKTTCQSDRQPAGQSKPRLIIPLMTPFPTPISLRRP